MRIRRPRHPLHGRSLAIYGWTHRQGRLELILVLPDGSKSLMPAAWTDLRKDADSVGGDALSASIATPSQLLHVRVVVDALLARSEQQQERGTQDSAP